MADGLFLFGSDQTAQVPGAGFGAAATGQGPAAANDATPRAPLGALYRENGRVWRYVQFDNGTANVTAAPYQVVHWKTLAPASGSFVVTNDYTDAIGANLIAGVLQGKPTDQYYTWIQVGGICTAFLEFTALTGDPVAAAAAGCKCYYPSTDTKFKIIEPSTQATGVVYGVLTAAANYTAATGTVLLQGPDW